VPERADLERYVSAALWQIAKKRYVLKPGTIGRCMIELAGRSIADSDAVIAEAVNRAATRAIRDNIAEIGPADIAAAARSVLTQTVRD
jgi:transitional endoplasmic reticulum ATPase